jgi:hypothetical protein
MIYLSIKQQELIDTHYSMQNFCDGAREIAWTSILHHSLYLNYVLWCQPSNTAIGWFIDLLVNKAYSELVKSL